MEFIIFLLAAFVIVFVIAYRNSAGQNIYLYVSKTAGNLYDKYAPYSLSLIHIFEKQVQKINSSTKEDNSEEETQKEYKGIFDYLANIFVNSYYVVLPIIIVICLFGIYRLNKKEKLF